MRASDDKTRLFWALRGVGGNFGVVTAFEFRLHPVGPEVMQAIVLYPLELRARRCNLPRADGARASDLSRSR